MNMVLHFTNYKVELKPNSSLKTKPIKISTSIITNELPTNKFDYQHVQLCTTPFTSIYTILIRLLGAQPHFASPRAYATSLRSNFEESEWKKMCSLLENLI